MAMRWADHAFLGPLEHLVRDHRLLETSMLKAQLDGLGTLPLTEEEAAA